MEADYSQVSKPENSQMVQLRIEDFLYVNKTYINFNRAMPGQVFEEAIEIANKSEESIVVQIFVDCLNSELSESDEYVYAIRRSHSGDYNDKHFIVMSPYSVANFKLAVKVPGTKLYEPIEGKVTFTVQGIQEKTSLFLETVSVMPKLVSPKQLFHTGLQCNVVKIAMKSNKKLEAKVPIKNLGAWPLSLETEMFVSSENTNEDDGYKGLCCPSTLTLASNTMGVINVLLKPESRSLLCPSSANARTIKKILVARCKDASIMFSFVLLIDIVE